MDLQSAVPALRRSASSLSVIIVEDEILLRMATASEFREGGHFVIEAATGDEALALLRRHANVDAVFSDVRMPGTIDGIGLAELVKLHYPNTRIFLTSGTLEAFPTNRTLAYGYFSKPYVASEVERVIRQACDNNGPGG